MSGISSVVVSVVVSAVAWLAFSSPSAALGSGPVRADSAPPPVTDTVYVWDLEKEPGECIGFLPKPGCGKEPQQAGDRGGALQWTVFGLILAGVGTVGSVLVRNVVKRDREIADRIDTDA